MRCSVIRIISTLSMIKFCHSLDLPCDFNFNQLNGYQCRVVNFANSDRFAYITDVLGDHLYESNKVRKRSNRSVNRITMWNVSVDYLPGNLTEWFPHLRTLLVKKCGLKELTRGEELNGLRKLYLGFNMISRLPVNYFWHFCRLESLSLHGNNISELPLMAFRDLISLKKLSFGDNQLRELTPGLFDTCESLEYVNFDNNRLEHIDGGLFRGRTQLSRIYLRNNDIKSIDNDFLSNLPNIRFAHFQNNTCIDESYPETPHPTQDLHGYFWLRFNKNCSHQFEETTTTPAPTTKPPRKKPKYENQSYKIYNFENCRWRTPKGHRYF